MNRRSFLGSLIGLVGGVVIGEKLNFLARLETEEWQRVILPYRMLFKDSISGFTIQAPGVAEIKPLIHQQGFQFVAEQLHILATMELDSAILLTEQGKVISESKFTNRVCMISGDAIKVTCRLHADKPLLLEELIDLGIKGKLK